MNKLIITVFLLCINAKSFSQIFIENFSYQAGIYLFQTGNWTNIGATQSPISVSPSGLTFPGYIGSGIGNMAAISADGGNSVYSLLSSQQTDGSVYASFMFRVVFPFTDGDFFFALRSSDTAYFARVYIKHDNAAKYQLAITKQNQSSVHFTSPLYDAGQTYLLVVKYKFISGSNNDEVSLFVFDVSDPPTPIEPAPTILPETNAAADAQDLDGVVLWQGESKSDLLLYVDGIYVNRGWFPDGAMPVELVNFSAYVSSKDVSLSWTTSNEINNSHFEIERNSRDVWKKTGTVQGNGTSTNTFNYSFTDKNLSPGIYKYRLKQFDFNGTYNYHYLSSEVEIKNPVSFSLNQNYPNPFNPSTTIGFEIPADGKVNIKVYDISGKEVAIPVDEFKRAGYHSVQMNAVDLPSGIYFYRMVVQNESNIFRDSKKMILTK